MKLRDHVHCKDERALWGAGVRDQLRAAMLDVEAALEGLKP